MTKKAVGKGLKALIPDNEKDDKSSTSNNGLEMQKPASESVVENQIVKKKEGEERTSNVNKFVAIDKEPDPLFIENLKKERERRVKAIAAMNELIQKYND